MRIRLLLLWIPVLLSACVSYKITDHKITTNEFSDLAYFEPLSYIGLIENDNVSFLNDSVSKLSKKLLEAAIVQSSSNKVPQKIASTNPKIQEKINKELSYIFRKILNYNNIKNVKITSTIDSVLKKTPHKFVLAVLVDGFVKTQTNSKQTTIDDLTTPISTLDLLEPVPNKPISNLHALIIDVNKKVVIFYDHTRPIHKQPTDKNNIDKQYQKLFKGFYHN